MFKLNSNLRNIFKTHREIVPIDYNMPLFITGCMRSGTSFLVNKLSSHPQLFKIGSELNKVWTEIGGATISDECEFKDMNESSNQFTYQMTNYFSEFIHESRSFKRHLMRINELFSNGLGLPQVEK